ncbi:hypothetical protein EST38_g5197 [Candolleomyces aberdarensis]|uniref:Protein kinase domain-containing protein n=1 Tax=Candolleomyces aberdarensis TaxID=2316362 RepID=A0A4V1Q431_9AGAR|nr:hypothetical protein EST38_g5197 [Candolleomyces aberdarensis]
MNLRNLDAPDAVTYLNEVKVHLKNDVASFAVFVQQVDKLLKGNSSQPSFSRSIVAIANILRNSPELFRGINSILRNGDRVECPNNSRVTLNEIPKPSTTDELLDVIVSKQDWNQLLATPHSKEYFTCVSQLLQVLLDELNTESVKSSTVYRCLRDLGDVHSILPPSIFMNHIKHDGQNYALQGGASSDIYKDEERDVFYKINEIVAGIDYLHHLDPPVTHNDIKGANVLVTDALTCCLADFGLSLILESQRLGNKSPTLAGSICWMAPELMTAGELESDPNGGQAVKREIDRKAGDIFALGCTIYEIFTGKPPHYHLNHIANVVCAVVIERKRPAVPPPEREWTETEVDMWWVVEQCWQHEPTVRPNIRLVKSYLEGLAANRGKKLTSGSPSPSVTEDISQEIVSASEIAKAQRWAQEQMGSILSKGSSERRFDEPSKTTKV